MATRKPPSFDQFPLFTPDSSWIAPTELPDLSRETEIAIDTETRDDMLAKDKGPGFYAYERSNPNTGFICGISLAWRDQRMYLPLRHYGEQSSFELDTVRRWLADLVSHNNCRFIFHNFGYDWGWIDAVFGINPPTKIDDTMAMASMINENLPSFKLEDLCAWQGLPGKDERILIEAMENFKVPAGDIKKYIWRLPAKFVGPYAEQDALATLKLSQKLRPLLAAENLEAAYQVECDLLPITLKMKQRGIRVDTLRAEKYNSDILRNCEDELFDFSKSVGEKVTIKHLRRRDWLKEQFGKHGLILKDLPRTQGGAESFEKSYMANHPHWFPRTAHKIKHQWDLADKFLQKFILKYALNGRIYATINQFRSEYGGARSHRFSYSDPPLQQMPSRDDEYAPLIRSCFIPEDGEFWCSIDYRQQEYRLIVFVAELMRARGAKKAADRYRNNPDTDFHQYVADITRLERRRAKDTNFAKAYGAGIAKFALMTGLGEEEARSVYYQYDAELPFVREASDRYSRYAANHGFIKLIDGARNHFNLWEPAMRDYNMEREYKERTPEVDTSPCLEDEYERRKKNKNHPWYGEQKKRAFTHKAFNRMIQGSAARQTKKAMVDLVKAGFQPVLQLHDELCFSLSNEKQAKECAEIMEQAMPVITIPMLTDVKLGPSWGQLKK
jgi:DNA polymerase I-like protein with 3'-5' exonuclease and polymerase domains